MKKKHEKYKFTTLKNMENKYSTWWMSPSDQEAQDLDLDVK